MTGYKTGEDLIEALHSLEKGTPLRVMLDRKLGLKQTIYCGTVQVQNKQAFNFFDDSGLNGTFALTEEFIRKQRGIIVCDFDHNDPLRLAELLRQLEQRR